MLNKNRDFFAVEKTTFAWEKLDPNDTIWWKKFSPARIGPMIFSFDKKKEFNVYGDYYKLTAEQKEIFNKENPGLAGLSRRCSDPRLTRR